MESVVSEKLKETYDIENISITLIEESEDSIVVSYQLEGSEAIFLSLFEKDNGDLFLINTREFAD